MPEPETTIGDIDAAVEKALAESGSSPDGSAAPAPSTSAPAAASPPAASAVAPGSGARVPDSATTAPASIAPAGTGTVKPGEPPPERWHAILDNTRRTVAQETERAVLDRYGISPQLDPATVRANVQALFTDPVVFHRMLGESLARQGHIRGRTGNAERRGPVTFDTTTPDGKPAFTGESVQRLLEEQEARIRGEVTGLLQPLQETYNRVEVREMRQRAWNDAAAMLADARTWDGFKELEPKIRELIATDGRVTLQSAYHRVHQEWLKGRDERTRQAALSEVRVAPAKSVRPGAAAPAAATGKRKKGGLALWDDAIEHALSKQAQ